jgi:hypothetical protein
MATITCHDARQHEECCDVCGKKEQNIAEVKMVDGYPRYICEACVHRMYVKCAAAFNIRPDLRKY